MRDKITDDQIVEFLSKVNNTNPKHIFDLCNPLTPKLLISLYRTVKSLTDKNGYFIVPVSIYPRLKEVFDNAEVRLIDDELLNKLLNRSISIYWMSLENVERCDN